MADAAARAVPPKSTLRRLTPEPRGVWGDALSLSVVMVSSVTERLLQGMAGETSLMPGRILSGALTGGTGGYGFSIAPVYGGAKTRGIFAYSDAVNSWT